MGRSNGSENKGGKWFQAEKTEIKHRGWQKSLRMDVCLCLCTAGKLVKPIKNSQDHLFPVVKPPIVGEKMESDPRPASRSNFCSYQGIDSTRLNRPAAPKVLPWQQDGNGDHNVFMVPATWGLRSMLSGDRTLPRARRVWAKSLHTRQQQNTEEPWQDGGREKERERREAGERAMDRNRRW